MPASQLQPAESPHRRDRAVLVAAGLGFAALAAGAVALWWREGPALFFEALVAGIMSCF